jgi:ribosome-associated protein
MRYNNPMKKTSAPKAVKATKAKAPKATEAAAPKAKASKSASAKPPHALLERVMALLEPEKLEEVVTIDLKNKSPIADHLVIATGTSARHIGAVASKLEAKLREDGLRCKIEGKSGGDWVILDAGDIIVHLFRAEVRKFYNLEKLWSGDFSNVEYNLYTPAS